MADERHDERAHGAGGSGERHEKTDISPKVAVVFGASLVVACLVVFVVAWGLFGYFRTANARYPRQYPLARVGPPVEPPAPRLQTDPRDELKQLRAEEEKTLDSYGWVDQDQGIVRMPIDRAMQLAVEQGLLPARSAPAGTEVPGLPEVSSSGRTLEPRHIWPPGR